MFFCYHGNIKTMTPNFNILGVKLPECSRNNFESSFYHEYQQSSRAREGEMQNNGFFSMFFCYHGNLITMTTNLNILGGTTQSVQEQTLNHLSIMTINKFTGELVSSREYLSFWLVAMETSHLVLYDNFSFT